MKPIIGILAKHYNCHGKRQNTFVRDEIKNAILDNGGIPIAILPTERAVFYTDGDKCENFLTQDQYDDLIQQIKLCDGIILQGGADSDKYEILVARYTFDNDIPTLGICAGQNNMIRAVKGTTKKVSNPEKHAQMWTELVHKVYVDKNSKFFSIVKQETFLVNSRHKNTIDNPTDYYKVAAVCEDGYYDVLEAPSKKFNLAIRFHPESLYKTHAEHNAIFQAFINACKKDN